MKRLVMISAVVAAFMFLLLGSAVTAQDFCKGNFDYDKDVDGTDASTFKQNFGRSAVKNPCPPDGPAPVERTWQSTSYAYGDDGYYQKGISWRLDRFTDNGNGTVTDKLTGLIWLKNANCFGQLNWYDALAAANGLGSPSELCGLSDGSSPGDWRLPNIKELLSLIDYDYVNPAMYQWQSFNNVQQSSWYWSATTFPDWADGARRMDIGDGSVGGDYKMPTIGNYVWPVRGGHPY